MSPSPATDLHPLVWTHGVLHPVRSHHPSGWPEVGACGFTLYLLPLSQVLPCERGMLMHWRPLGITGVTIFIGEGFLFTPVSIFGQLKLILACFIVCSGVPSGLAGFSGQRGYGF